MKAQELYDSMYLKFQKIQPIWGGKQQVGCARDPEKGKKFKSPDGAFWSSGNVLCLNCDVHCCAFAKAH